MTKLNVRQDFTGYMNNKLKNTQPNVTQILHMTNINCKRQIMGKCHS